MHAERTLCSLDGFDQPQCHRVVRTVDREFLKGGALLLHRLAKRRGAAVAKRRRAEAAAVPEVQSPKLGVATRGVSKSGNADGTQLVAGHVEVDDGGRISNAESQCGGGRIGGLSVSQRQRAQRTSIRQRARKRARAFGGETSFAQRKVLQPTVVHLKRVGQGQKSFGR